MAWFSVTYREHRGNTHSICERCYHVWFKGRSHAYIIGRYDGTLPVPCSLCNDTSGTRPVQGA